MARTISSRTTTGVTLTAAYDPLRISATGTITVGNGFDAVYGNASQSWEVDNAGLILAATDSAIDLAAASLVTNTGTIAETGAGGRAIRIGGGAGTVINNGTISGAQDGVALGQGGTVSNTGSIGAGGTGYGIDVSGGTGIVTNAGSIAAGDGGVRFRAGGAVNNTGSIGATATNGIGVYIGGGAATVINAGTISGVADALLFGGTYTDRVILDPGAVFVGAVAGSSGGGTFELAAGSAGAAGTLSGKYDLFPASGVSVAGFGTIAVDRGADWVFGASSRIDPDMVVTDAGTTLVTAGTLLTGVTVTNAGTVINTGQMASNGAPSAISLTSGGVVENIGAGYIRGLDTAVSATGGFATVTNSGTMSGGLYGIALNSGGTVTNTGLISAGSYAGVLIAGNDGTLINAGTIAGGANGVAVELTGTLGERVILDPGATFQGTVQGSVLGINYNRYYGVLELAAGATGTLIGIGTSFTNFGSIVVDAGASWLLPMSSTVDPHVDLLYYTTLTVAGGTLGNAGTIELPVTVTSGGTFSNTGTLVSTTNKFATVTVSGGGEVNNLAGTAALLAGVDASGAAATVTNAGTISDSFYGVKMSAGGTVTNTGTISGGSAAVYIGGGAATLTNAGTLAGRVQFGGAFNDRLIVDPGAAFTDSVQGGGGNNVLELAAGGAGTLTMFDTRFMGFGTIALDPSAAWTLDGASPATGQSIILAGTNDVLGIDTPGSFTDDILGFDGDDGLDLTGLAFSQGATATVTGNTLTVVSGGTSVSLNVFGLPSSDVLTVTDDATAAHGAFVAINQTESGNGGIGNSSACYCRGTLILTDRGEVAVEDLTEGDRLITRAGEARPIKWIGRRSYAGALLVGNARVLPICFKPGALADRVPRRELWVSPEHAMFLDDALVPAGLLVNGTSIVQAEALEEVHYFHLELDTHDVIVAEGALSETFVDDNSRGIFHNVAAFHARFPGAVAEPAVFCAPRLEDGFALDALQRRLAGRARLLRIDGTADPSSLMGYLDEASHACLKGWAFDPATPGVPVVLSVFANGAQIGSVVADRLRSQLLTAGIGDGRHAFEFWMPAALARDMRHEIELRCPDGRVLAARCGTVLEPLLVPVAPQPPAQPPLGALRGALDAADRLRLSGWAQDAADAERPVGLAVLVNGNQVARVLANRHRADLEQAGLGSGRHSFDLVLTEALPATAAQEIRVVREADRAELPGSPVCLPPVRGLDEATTTQFEAMLARLEEPAEQDRALALLTRHTEALLERRAGRTGSQAERAARALLRRRQGRDAVQPRDTAAPAALVIDLLVPDASRDAGSVAILSHIRALRALGHAVSFAAAEEMANPALAGLAAREAITACGTPHYGCIEDILRLHAGQFDLIYLHRPLIADRYLALVRRHCPKARLVFSVADLHHVRLARQARVERRPELLAYSRHLAATEALAARRADAVVTHSPAEADLLRQAAGFGRVHVVPFAVPVRPGRRSFGLRHGIAFIGGAEHAPNADAVHHLIHDILPLVWAVDPAITCRIVGHGWSTARLPGLDPRITVAGPVDDLKTVLDAVRLTVAPLRFGAGIKGKVLDSLAASVPCVLTGIAAEGLTLPDTLRGLVADEPTALADRILRLHGDASLHRRAAREGVDLMTCEFSQERVVAALATAIGQGGEAIASPSALARLAGGRGG